MANGPQAGIHTVAGPFVSLHTVPSNTQRRCEPTLLGRQDGKKAGTERTAGRGEGRAAQTHVQDSEDQTHDMARSPAAGALGHSRAVGSHVL